MQVTVCGGGNAAHTAVGLLASRDDLIVNVYLSYEHEARKWLEGNRVSNGIQVLQPDGYALGKPCQISSNPGEVLPGSKLVLLTVPAFAHEDVLREIAPHLDMGAWVGALPARSCFELCVQDVLKEKLGSITIFGLQTLPWACRIQHYGQQVLLLGTKSQVDLAVEPQEQATALANCLSDLLGLMVNPVASFLSLTLAGTGQLVHPGIMYGLFHGWDGAPYAQAPLFYQGVDAESASVLQSMSNEVQMIRAALEQQFSDLDLSAVRPLDEWLRRSYPQDIEDSSTLQSCLNTNRSYTELRAPMRALDGGLEPDFQARYLSEDVPYSLVGTLGIAELADIPVAVIKQVVQWAQERLGKEYLVDGEMCGRDLVHTRAPQRYGIRSIDPLVLGIQRTLR